MSGFFQHGESKTFTTVSLGKEEWQFKFWGGEAKGSKECLLCFIEKKKFYEVLFPVEDIIIIFCWETFWLVYSKDLI